jgi:hypothetical protein
MEEQLGGWMTRRRLGSYSILTLLAAPDLGLIL